MGNGPDLSRFIQAQKQDYDTALREIRNGRKESHWMWYIFPQIRGLGTSRMSEYYAVQSRGEAAAFLEDPYLGRNLEEITRALLELDGNDAYAVFGYPDHMKLEESNRHALFNGIHQAILRNGGVITVYYTMDLELARKPFR